MDSLEAMDHIDRMFLTVDESLWLPQWSFDFWIIPYLLGKGISLAQFKEFMTQSHKLLSLEIASVAEHEKNRMQQEYLHNIGVMARNWKLLAEPPTDVSTTSPSEMSEAMTVV